ncbi:MAG: hypothetical protein ACYDAM_06815 [Leptospirales bacterium]
MMFSKNGIVLFLLLIMASVTGNIPGITTGQSHPEGKLASGQFIHPPPQSTRSFPASTASLLLFSSPVAPLPDLCHHVETNGSPSLDCSHRHSGSLSGTWTLDYLASDRSSHPFESFPEQHDSNPHHAQSADGSILKHPPRPLPL